MPGGWGAADGESGEWGRMKQGSQLRRYKQAIPLKYLILEYLNFHQHRPRLAGLLRGSVLHGYEVPPVFRLPRGGVHATSFSFC